MRYGNFDASESSVLEAARRTGIDEFAGSLPGGFATMVGGNGQGLSTGQRQRIAIARALLRRPKVLVLDEALTNLDVYAAQTLQLVIDEQFERCTRIVISHAPARVPRADVIYEMRDGGLRQSCAVLHA